MKKIYVFLLIILLNLSLVSAEIKHECTDSDGNDIYVKGTGFSRQYDDATLESYSWEWEDTCVNAQEFGIVISDIGAAEYRPVSICPDDKLYDGDSGIPPKIGECLVISASNTPSCSGEKCFLNENYCTDKKITKSFHVRCPNDCKDGACIKCTSNAGDCCLAESDGVCDKDCEEGKDPDCEVITVCNENDACEIDKGETSSNCPKDCYCGDKICEDTESKENCPEDCEECVPEFGNCKLEPAICPSEGIQNKVCYDTKCGTEKVRTESLKCEPGACEGCFANGICYPVTTRAVLDGTPSYCDVTKTFKNQKELEEDCQNDYECVTNECSSGKCADIKKELEETRSLLEKVLSWLKELFTGEKETEIEKLVICNPPYIQFADSCCLDKNDNKICDNDEVDQVSEEFEIPEEEFEIPEETAEKPEQIFEKQTLNLEEYNGGFFSIKKPSAWKILQGGSCGSFAIYMKDENNPARQVFYFGEVGPVYLDEQQKQFDLEYMQMGGYEILWNDAPVVKPLNPENFLKSFQEYSQTKIAKSFMPELPTLNDVEIISSEPSSSLISGGEAETMRALFKEQGILGEGMFYVTTAVVLPMMGSPGSGIGYGFSFIGISAGKDEFKNLEEDLTEAVSSFELSQEYVSNCLQQQAQQTASTLKAGKTLSETSDMMIESWESRDKSDDILSEKRSDVILGRDRIYNPDTGEVYNVELDFYDNYNINREKYEMSNLKKLPENDWNLWTASTSDETYIY